MKTLFVVIASIVILIAAVIFVFVSKDFILISATVALVILAFYALWKPPKKHKDFSLQDRDNATIRALGGSGIPDISQLNPEEQKPHPERHKKHN